MDYKSVEELKDQGVFDDVAFPSMALGDSFYKYPKQKLRSIIQGFTGKWPHTPKKEILASCVGELVEYYHYEFLHHKPMSEKIKQYRQEAYRRLDLRDKKMTEENIETDNGIKVKKSRHRDVGDGVAEKLRGMSIEEMLAWEKELGADDATIKKHKKINQAGRQRMSVGNKLRYLLRKKKKG